MGKRGPKPRGKVSTKWSPELAYVVGLIATDGNLSKDGRHIDFTSKDEELARTFKKCLNLEVMIGRKSSGSVKEKRYFRVQFGDVLFYQWLMKLGITPNKSKTLGALNIPDELFFDFLRGCFDGDGSIYAYWDPRWHSSYMFYTSFASASIDFLKWLQATIERLSGQSGRIATSTRSYQLRFAKKGSLVLSEKMYHSKNVPCLNRKFTKSRKIFRINENHNKQ